MNWRRRFFNQQTVQSNFLATFLELDLYQPGIQLWPLSENKGLRRLASQGFLVEPWGSGQVHRGILGFTLPTC